MLLAPWLWLSPSQAAPPETSGVVVQLTRGEGAEGPALVTLSTAESQLEVSLNDAGEAPDVQAGDGIWAGATMVPAGPVTVRLAVDGQELELGEVSWSAEGGPRDLHIRRAEDGSYSASTTQAGPGSATPVQPSTPVQSSPTPASSPSTSSPGSDRSTLFIALGAGLLLLAGAAMLWLRKPSAGYAVKTRAKLRPEPPLLGPGSPSLSDGSALWVLAPEHRAAFLPALLERMARHHRVLVSGYEPPPVFGGPVYLSDPGPARQLGDCAEALLAGPGAPLALLAVDPELPALEEQLPEGVGAVYVVSMVPEAASQLPQVRVQRTEAGWRLEGAAPSMDLDGALKPIGLGVVGPESPC